MSEALKNSSLDFGSVGAPLSYTRTRRRRQQPIPRSAARIAATENDDARQSTKMRVRAQEPSRVRFGLADWLACWGSGVGFVAKGSLILSVGRRSSTHVRSLACEQGVHFPQDWAVRVSTNLATQYELTR